ncbi:restriction system modified-DNA reader domain-containing protein [Streptomyces smyrnaeus]|uniref:restriction system modified-DNA reader domain-containing protein n=1 Tax=Streptomyces smyrnaeus TaxID=1387713 RepID=UPI00367BE34A
MGTTIRVDDEVYAELQRRAEAFVDTPNSTLRRVLGLGEPSSAGTGAEGAERHYGLAAYLADGRLKVGQRLVWERPRRGEKHTAEVLESGSLRVEGKGVFGSPSAAASAISGNQERGPAVWRTEDGVRLMDL